MSDNWRIRIQPPEAEHGETLLERLGLDLGSDEAKRLAKELQGHRLAVSRDDDTIFVYAETQPQAEQARGDRRGRARRRGHRGRSVEVERWLPEEERWSDEPPQETWEQEEVERGHAPWEVRVELPSHAGARSSPTSSEAEGYESLRRWRYLIVGTSTREEARTRSLSASTARPSRAAQVRLGSHAPATRSRSSAASAQRDAPLAAPGSAILLGATLATGLHASALSSLRFAARRRAAGHAETIEQPTLAPEAPDGLAASALQAEAWAGEPFLHPDEDPAVVLAPGTARRRALDDAARRDRGRRAASPRTTGRSATR